MVHGGYEFKIESDDFAVSVPDLSGLSIESLYEWLYGFETHGHVIGNLITRFREESCKSPLEKGLEPLYLDKDLFTIDDDREMTNQILEKLEEIKSLSKTNDKKEVLQAINDGDAKFRHIFVVFANLVFSECFTFDCTLKLFTSKPPKEFQSLIPDLFSILEDLTKIGLDNYMSPTEKKTNIWNMWNCSKFDGHKRIIEMIIGRDIKAGVKSRVFRSIFGFDISIIPYQRCEKESKLEVRANYPMIVQEKCDGKFQNFLYSAADSTGATLNRSGKRSNNPIMQDFLKFDEETGYITAMWGSCPFVNIGEGLIKIPGINIDNCEVLDIPVLDRQTGNGLLSSYGNHPYTIYSMEKRILEAQGKKKVNKLVEALIRQLLEWQTVYENTIVQFWNVIPYEHWLNLESDWTQIKGYSYVYDFVETYRKWCASKGMPQKVFLCQTNFAEDEDELYALYHWYLSKHKEGVVAKNQSAPWEHEVSTQGIIKFKDFHECDLEVIGWLPGEKQYTGGIGSLVCKSKCGIVNVNVSGMKRKDRGFQAVDPANSAAGIELIPGWDNDCWNGSIINVKFTSASKDKKGNPSLSLATMEFVRDDKNEAETYEEILYNIKHGKKRRGQ